MDSTQLSDSSPDPAHSQITHWTTAEGANSCVGWKVELVEQQWDCTAAPCFAGSTDTELVEGAVVADNSAKTFVGRAVHTVAEDSAGHTAAKALVGWAVHTDTEPHTAVEVLVELTARSFDLPAFVGRAGGSFDLLPFVGLVEGSMILVHLGTLFL
jgi:hypothetical protein